MALAELAAQTAVVHNEDFDGCELHDQIVRSRFVGCTFNKCRFSGLQSQHAFWGGGTSWTNCSFSNCDCSRLISAHNRFENCQFTNFAFTYYSPYETTFINSTFDSVRFSVLRAQPNARNQAIRQQYGTLWPYPEIAELDSRRASVLFRKCVMISPRFHRVYFNNIIFDRCDVQSPELLGCSFTGIQNLQDQWWSEHDDTNPERQYVVEVHAAILTVLGESSIAARLSQDWIDQSPITSSHADWFDYLLDNGLPDEEFDVVDELLNGMPTL